MSFCVHVLIPNSASDRVLLVPDGAGWALPRMTSEDWEEVESVRAEALKELGLEVAILRPAVLEGLMSGPETGDVFLLTENLGANSPLRGAWFDESDTTGLDINDRDRPLIEQWFEEERNGVPDILPDFQRKGWFRSASEWVEQALPGVTRVDQSFNRSISAVLLAHANARRYYFKAVPDFFMQEAAITALLAEHFPEAVPRPVAVDAERGWMLLEDFGDVFVGDLPVEQWGRSLDALVALQRASIPRLSALLESRIRDSRPKVLASEIESLAAEAHVDCIPDEIIVRLRAAVPRLQNLCAELDTSPIPSTLVHGDFHAYNIAVQEGRHIIFDWSDAAIAHPFMDLPTFLYMFGPASTEKRLGISFAIGTWNLGPTSCPSRRPCGSTSEPNA